MIRHESDCATHNEPAYPNGPCDCNARFAPMLDAERATRFEWLLEAAHTEIAHLRAQLKLARAETDKDQT
jgi:hypothetical protein